jgi:hypothetical protein
MLLTLAIYFFLKKKYWLFNVMAFLSFMTFYGSVFLLAALALYLLIKKRYKELVISNIGLLLAVVILLPLIRTQMQNSQEMLLEVKNWSLVLGRANLKNLLLIPIKFTSGRISFYPKIVYYLIAGGWAIFIFLKLVKRNFYSFVFWTTLLIGTVFSIFTPLLQYFRFLYLIPVMALVIKKDKLIVAGFLIFSLVYLLNPKMWREDWKTLVSNLNGPVYMIESLGDPVRYYNPQIKINDIREGLPAGRQEITVIPYGEGVIGIDHKSILKKAGYSMKMETDYREVTTEVWIAGSSR